MRLKKERTKAGLTQKQLAGMAGVTQASISLIEKGKVKNPGLETMSRILWALRKCGSTAELADLNPRRQPLLVRGARRKRGAA